MKNVFLFNSVLINRIIKLIYECTFKNDFQLSFLYLKA